VARLDSIGIVITRPRQAAEALAAELTRVGARPIVFPALDIEDLPWSGEIEATLARLSKASWAVFVSANAVEKGLAAAQRTGGLPRHLRLAAVGEATARALKDAGFAEVVAPHERHDSEALLECAALQSVAGERVMIFRGEGGRERLKEGLEERGAQVEYVECYRRVRPAMDPDPLLAAWSRGEVQAVSVLSGETLENFLESIGPRGARLAASTPLLVPHENVARHRDTRAFARVIVTGHGTPALVDALSRLRTAA